MAIRRFKSRRKKNPARARSLVANPGHKRKHKMNPRHKRKANPRHKRRKHSNPGLTGAGGIFSQANLQMAMNVGIGAAAAVAVGFYANRFLFQETKDNGATYQPTKFAVDNPTIAKIGPGAIVAIAGLAVGSMVQNKQVKAIAYGAAAAGVANAVFSGVGPKIQEALEGKKEPATPPAPGKTEGYLPGLSVYGMSGAFGHTERYGHSAGAYLGYDGAGNVSGYFIEGGQTMAGFAGF